MPSAAGELCQLSNLTPKAQTATNVEEGVATDCTVYGARSRRNDESEINRLRPEGFSSEQLSQHFAPLESYAARCGLDEASCLLKRARMLMIEAHSIEAIAPR